MHDFKDISLKADGLTLHLNFCECDVCNGLGDVWADRPGCEFSELLGFFRLVTDDDARIFRVQTDYTPAKGNEETLWVRLCEVITTRASVAASGLLAYCEGWGLPVVGQA